MSPGLSQSAPAGWSSPSCQHPSLLSPHSGWIQQGSRGLERSPWGSVLEDRNKVLEVLPSPASSLCSPGLSWGQTQGKDSPHPAWALWLVLTKHSPSSHIRSFCSRFLSSFHLRSSAAAKRASPEACRTELAQRWHQGWGKRPLGFIPAVIPPLGSCDLS